MNMSRLFQKVPEHIRPENQNHKRPNRFCRGYPSPPPGCVQTVQNRVRVARVARACVVCRVRYERALEGLLWASSGITVRDPSCARCSMRCSPASGFPHDMQSLHRTAYTARRYIHHCTTRHPPLHVCCIVFLMPVLCCCPGGVRLEIVAVTPVSPVTPFQGMAVGASLAMVCRQHVRWVCGAFSASFQRFRALCDLRDPCDPRHIWVAVVKRSAYPRGYDRPQERTCAASRTVGRCPSLWN